MVSRVNRLSAKNHLVITRELTVKKSPTLYETEINKVTKKNKTMKPIQSFENFLNESLRPDELESQVRDITFLFRQHNRGVKGKHSDKQIVDVMKKYQPYQKLTSKQKDEVLDLVKKALNESLNEALRPDELERLSKDLAYSMPNHTKYDDSEGPSDKQIMDAMKKYQKDLYQYSTKKQKEEVLDIVKKILNESSL